MDLEQKARIATFNWLAEQKRIHGEVLPRKLLEKGFGYKGTQIALVSPQGIFRPKILKYPLSITTAPKGPYEDVFDAKGFLVYRYRGTNPNHLDNVGLRETIKHNIPLVYFHGIVPGKYLAVWPVYVVQDNSNDFCFTVAVDDIDSIEKAFHAANTLSLSEARRAYITAEVKVRLHQSAFREKVLLAYKTQCAFCRLRHEELLDAAHIIPDNEPK
jgi:putative restriction endonuclease